MRHQPVNRYRTTVRAVLTLLVLSMVAAGCGSTAQVGLEGPAVAPDGQLGVAASEDGLALADDGLAAPDSGDAAAFDPAGGEIEGQAPSETTAGAAPGTTTAGGGAASGPSGATAGSGSSSDAASGGRSAAAPSGAGTGRMGPGVTAKEIVIGIPIADDSSPGNAELHGLEGVTQGDIERYYDIIREEMNKSGGIAGRKIRYSKFRYSTADGAQASQLEQAACAHWTQDDRAYIAGFSTTDNFLSCAEKNQLATTASTLTSSDDRTFAKYPHHLEISAMSLTRQMINLPAGLVAQKYFSRDYKLGVVTFDDPPFARAVDGTLAPQLARYGKKISNIQRVSRIRSNEDLGKLTAEMQSAVLRFKTDGITHVLIVDANGLLTLLFTRSAENQGYRPRYGMTSQNGPTALAAAVPEGQFDRAVGIGWVPNFDVPARELPANAPRDRCLAMFKKHGQEPADPNNAVIMAGVCEEMYFFKAAVEAGGPDVTVDSFVRGAEALRDSFPSYTSLGNNVFGPGRHAGAAFYRHIVYDRECVCFHYRGKLVRDA